MATRMPVTEIVNVNVTRQLITPSLEDFGLLCYFVDDSTLAQGAYQVFNSYEAFQQVFTTSGSSIDIYVDTFFSQNPSPTKIALARVDIAGGDTYPDVIEARRADLDFYAVGIDNLTLSDADFTAVAAKVQQQKLLWVQQRDNTTAAALAASLIALDYHRTAIVSKDDIGSDGNRVDAAWLGNSLTKQAGSFNWANEHLETVNASDLSVTAIDTLWDARVNVYAQVGKDDIMRRGATCGTDWRIDQVQGMDWLEINLKEAIRDLLVNNDKLAYTDVGMNIAIGQCMKIAKDAIDLNILAATPKPKATAPSVFTMSASDRAEGIAPAITMTCRLAGSINNITVDVPVEV